MSVINVTPDSFSDGGDFLDPQKALHSAKKALSFGASILDIGGESTAPGSTNISAEEEWNRIAPVLQALLPLGASVSVDTWRGEIAKKALSLGVSYINDVTAFRGDATMISVLAESSCGIVLMYAKDSSPRTTLEKKQYADVIKEVGNFLEERLVFAQKNGVAPERIILDPGMGAFLSADPSVSFEMIARLGELKQRFPNNKILIGTSRKGFLQKFSFGKEPRDRTIPSIISSLCALQNGADIVRVHDTREMKEAIDIFSSLCNV